MEDHRKAVGARLRELRKSRSWSQEDAAHEIGVAVKTWSNWERGRTDPYDSNWKRITEVFEVDVSEIRGTPPAPLALSTETEWQKRIEEKLDAILALLHEQVSDELVRSLREVPDSDSTGEQGSGPSRARRGQGR